MQLEDLVGKHIKRALYDQKNIYLEMADDKVLTLSPEGDCCANCFIQHVSIAYALQDAVIGSIEDVTIDSTEAEESDGCTQVWAHWIHTNKGSCMIEMRVDHNGYYSGWLAVTDKFVRYLSDGREENSVRRKFKKEEITLQAPSDAVILDDF